MSGTAFLSLIERLDDWQARNSVCHNLILHERNGFSSQGLTLWGAIGPLMRLQQKSTLIPGYLTPRQKR
jgi:hypothetical protein